MSSTVACIGFTDPSSLASIVREKGEPVHELSSTNLWVDSSGATLYLDRGAQYARPGFSTPVRTPYRGIVPMENGLAQVVLTDVSGFELDPFTVVPNNRYTVGWAPVGRVALVAMGIDTEFFPTAEDFFDSPRSALPGFEGEPPAEVKQFGLAWPPAMEIETFLPSDKSDDALATLSGTVQFAEVQKNSLTDHEFLVSRIATVCGEIDLCTPLPLEGAPTPGSVVVGQVELLAGFPPFGVDDTSGYQAPDERVSPTFRDGEPEIPSDLPPMDDDLPEGLVLGEDGVVRTDDEHRAWKGGDTEAGSRPPEGVSRDTLDPASPEDEYDARREVPDLEVDPEAPTGVAGEGALDATPSAETSTGAETNGSQTSDATDSAESYDPSDDAPRPGETRREWRMRTGR